MKMQLHVIQTHCDDGPPQVYLITTDYDHAEKTFCQLVSNFIATYKTAIVKKHGECRTEIVVKHPDRRLFVDWLKHAPTIGVNIK